MRDSERLAQGGTVWVLLGVALWMMERGIASPAWFIIGGVVLWVFAGIVGLVRS